MRPLTARCCPVIGCAPCFSMPGLSSSCTPSTALYRALILYHGLPPITSCFLVFCVPVISSGTVYITFSPVHLFSCSPSVCQIPSGDAVSRAPGDTPWQLNREVHGTEIPSRLQFCSHPAARRSSTGTATQDTRHTPTCPVQPPKSWLIPSHPSRHDLALLQDPV